MPKKSVKQEFKNFSKGLITEATQLNFPPNAAQEINNFVLNRDGSLQRRLGLNSEPSGTMQVTTSNLQSLQDVPLRTYTWYNVNGTSGLSFLCVTFGTEVFFYDLSADILSVNGFRGTLSLSTLLGNGNSHRMASVNGYLAVVNGTENIGVISYDGVSFTLSTVKLMTRDIWGIWNANSDVDRYYQPTAVDNTHMYNLYNQSWAMARRNSSSVLVDPVAEYFNVLGHYPSDTEAVWEGLKYNASFGSGGPTELFFPKVYLDTFGSRSTVAKGFFIIELLRRGQSRSYAVALNAAKNTAAILTSTSGGSLFSPGGYIESNPATATVGNYTFTYTSSNIDYTPGGPKVICSFAGRIWYGGFQGTVIGGDPRSPRLNSYVAFSQLIKNTQDINKCYQDGDPSSRDSSDLVDTDGGLIQISGAEEILEMRTIGDVLLVFCSNGVWAISGGNNYGFSATNYKVIKVTSFGCLSPAAVIDDTDDVYFWSSDGIYQITKNQLGDFVANNITIGTINTFYDDISPESKQTVCGVMDTTGRKVRWVWYEGDFLTVDCVTKELVLDLALKAFTINTIKSPTTVPTLPAAPFKSVAFTAGNLKSGVVDQGSPVTYNGVQVITTTEDQSASVLSTRYIILQNISNVISFTFGYYRDDTFVDWAFSDGVGIDATAHLIAGSITAGDSSVAKQVPYLMMFLRRTETGLDSSYVLQNQSSCLIQGQWNWATNANSNKWSSQQQAYRPSRINMPDTSDGSIDPGFPVVVTRNKFRGRGKAFALRIDTEANKDCQIIGWEFNINGNENT